MRTLTITSLVALALTAPAALAQTQQLYCLSNNPAKDLRIELNSSTGEVRWNSAANLRRGMNWYGPARALVNHTSIKWVGFEDGAETLYQVDKPEKTDTTELSKPCATSLHCGYKCELMPQRF